MTDEPAPLTRANAFILSRLASVTFPEASEDTLNEHVRTASGVLSGFREAVLNQADDLLLEGKTVIPLSDEIGLEANIITLRRDTRRLTRLRFIVEITIPENGGRISLWSNDPFIEDIAITFTDNERTLVSIRHLFADDTAIADQVSRIADTVLEGTIRAAQHDEPILNALFSPESE